MTPVALGIAASLLLSAPPLLTKARPPDAGSASTVPAPRHIKVGVTEAGFEPNEIPVKPGETVILEITRVTDQTCATAIVVADQKIHQDLPLNMEIPVTLHAGKEGTVTFACPMNMITGALVVKP